MKSKKQGDGKERCPSMTTFGQKHVMGESFFDVLSQEDVFDVFWIDFSV